MIPDVTLDLSSKIWILDSDPMIHPSLQQATARRPDSAPHFTLTPPLRHHSCKTQRAIDRRQCPESESDPGSRAFGRDGLGRRACLGSASGGLQLSCCRLGTSKSLGLGASRKQEKSHKRLVQHHGNGLVFIHPRHGGRYLCHLVTPRCSHLYFCASGGV